MSPVQWFAMFGRVLFVLAMGISLSPGCAPLPSTMEVGEGQGKRATITSVKAAMGEKGPQVIIEGSGPFSYSLTNHDRPPRVTVEIPDGRFAQLRPRIPVNKGVVQSIALQDRQGQAQVEVALGRLVDYEVQKDENRLILKFKEPPDASGRRPLGETPWSASPESRMPEAPQTGTALQSQERQGSIVQAGTATAGLDGPPNPMEYVIGGMDVLDVAVYQEKDLSGTFRVAADGHIAFPLVGNVQVAGLTPPQMEERLEKMLREGYIKRPQLAVTVKEYRSKGVSVLGAVNKPGAYYLWGGRMTLLELLSVAGGVSLEEGGKSLILLRPDEKGDTKSITIDLDRLLKEGDPSANLHVQPNDAIYVAKADSIIVYGEVQKPGPYPIESGGMTILEAVSRAGGFTKFAAPNRTRIVRVDGGVEKTIRVRVGDIVAKGERTREFFLMPGDVIVIPEGYF